MPRFNPMDYAIVNLSGENYQEWKMNISIALKSRGFKKCIIEGNDEIESEKHRTITIMHHHLTKELRN